MRTATFDHASLIISSLVHLILKVQQAKGDLMMTQSIGFFNRTLKFYPLLKFILLSLAMFIVFSSLHNFTYAQQVYQLPPKAIADLVDAPPTPLVSFSPNHQWMLIMDRASLPSIEELSQPELRLAGLRFNPRTNGLSRASFYTKISLKNIQNVRFVKQC